MAVARFTARTSGETGVFALRVWRGGGLTLGVCSRYGLRRGGLAIVRRACVAPGHGAAEPPKPLEQALRG